MAFCDAFNRYAGVSATTSTTEVDRAMATAGRPVSIPETVRANVHQWHGDGLGCRRIAKLLEKHGVSTTRGSVHRLLRGEKPYDAVPVGDLNDCKVDPISWTVLERC